MTRWHLPIAIALVLLFVASMAGDGVFRDAQVFALPWYGVLYHMLKTIVAGWWANETIAKAICRGEAGEP